MRFGPQRPSAQNSAAIRLVPTNDPSQNTPAGGASSPWFPVRLMAPMTPEPHCFATRGMRKPALPQARDRTPTVVSTKGPGMSEAGARVNGRRTPAPPTGRPTSLLTAQTPRLLRISAEYPQTVPGVSQGATSAPEASREPSGGARSEIWRRHTDPPAGPGLLRRQI